MQNCLCTGSSERPPCSTIDIHRLAFSTHEDLCGLVFNRSSASKTLGLDPPQTTSDLSTKFTLFPYLPPELRLEIWKYALNFPRLIVVSYTTTTGEDDKRVFVDTPPPPSCLSVCRESRVEALKVYSNHFITSLCRAPTPINFASDCFLLGGPDADIDIDYLMSLLLPETSHRIRHLHVSRGCYKEFAYWTHLRPRYPGLEELTISFPTGAALLPYTHECWYAALPSDNKNHVIKDELFEREDEEMGGWRPSFKLNIVHYDSPPLKGKY